MAVSKTSRAAGLPPCPEMLPPPFNNPFIQFARCVESPKAPISNEEWRCAFPKGSPCSVGVFRASVPRLPAQPSSQPQPLPKQEAAPAPLSAPVAAAPESDTERASLLFTKGQKLFAEGQFADAEKAFQAAYDIKPHPVALANVADCVARQGDRKRAIELFKRVRDDKVSNRDVRKDAQKKIAQLRREEKAAQKAAAAAPANEMDFTRPDPDAPPSTPPPAPPLAPQPPALPASARTAWPIEDKIVLGALAVFAVAITFFSLFKRYRVRHPAPDAATMAAKTVLPQPAAQPAAQAAAQTQPPPQSADPSQRSTATSLFDQMLGRESREGSIILGLPKDLNDPAWGLGSPDANETLELTDEVLAKIRIPEPPPIQGQVPGQGDASLDARTTVVMAQPRVELSPEMTADALRVAGTPKPMSFAGAFRSIKERAGRVFKRR